MADLERQPVKELLYTYLGKRTGERVLTGQVLRGDAEKIHAVIWFCDLRDSTRLSESMPVEDFFALLNDFFECTAGAVLDHGGEILSYIGDAALAIFPIAGADKPFDQACTPEEGACAAALAAARDALAHVDALNREREKRGQPELRFGIALHAGDVMYGNIGVPGRLEFTVIGAATNEASRLAGLCKSLGQAVLVSSRFPGCFPDQLISLGRHALQGIDEPQEVFGLADRQAAGSCRTGCSAEA